MKYSTPEAYELLHQGSLALAEVEHNGIRIDTEYVNSTRKQIARRCNRLEVWMKRQKEWEVWRKTYGTESNLGSGDQLSHVLFDRMKFKPSKYTEKGKPSTDRSSLEAVGTKFCTRYIEWTELQKASNTFLAGIQKETVNGYLHPIFNLHFIKTYRSSSEAPNFQNFPVRNKRISELVRQAFIPRKGGRIVEIDYGGIEVKIAACYHKDPVMMEYIHDPSKDMHRDMAAEIYLCDPSEVNKMLRYAAKNRYVFPEFYGSYWEQVGPDLWNGIDTLGLEVCDRSAKDWLAEHGIKKLGSGGKVPTPGSFMEHIKRVEHNFWNKRFRVYNEWRNDWYKSYLETGGYRTLTGFYIRGVFKRNDVINHPVQGSAFHCLLWSLIRLNKELRKRKMKAKLIGQIHDSIVADVPDDEFELFLKIAKRIMTEDIRDEWDWINVPLAIEAEACEVGETWFHKKEVPV